MFLAIPLYVSPPGSFLSFAYFPSNPLITASNAFLKLMFVPVSISASILLITLASLLVVAPLLGFRPFLSKWTKTKNRCTDYLILVLKVISCDWFCLANVALVRTHSLLITPWLYSNSALKYVFTH